MSSAATDRSRPAFKAPLVSVYIPTHNRWELLQRAVDSVLAQEGVSFEVLVTDDGSTDATVSELPRWAEREPRLTALRIEPSGGAPAARNLAIRRSTGAFITGLDDDDAFAPGRLRAFIERWGEFSGSAEPPTLLYGVSRVMGDGEERAPSSRKSVGSADLCRGNYIGNQVFAPRQVWLDSGGFAEELRGWQDLDLWIRMLGPDGRAICVHDAVQWIDQEEGRDRISSRPLQEMALTRDQVVGRHAALGGKAQFHLYCQMFSAHYGFEPSWADVWAAVRLHPRPSSLLRILKLKKRRRRQRGR